MFYSLNHLFFKEIVERILSKIQSHVTEALNLMNHLSIYHMNIRFLHLCTMLKTCSESCFHR